MPDPAIGQREAINKAIDAADTAVAAVNNNSLQQVTTADGRIADARAAIDAAAHVPDPEKTAFTGTVDALATRLRTAKTARTDAMTAAQQAADKAVMEKAGKLHKGIQEYDKSGIIFRSQSLNDNNNAGRIGAGFSGRNVHVWIRRAIPNPVVLKEDKKAVVAPLHGAQGWRATAAPDGGGTYEATAYRASSEPRQGDKFSMQYSANFSNGVLNTATTEAAANRVASPSFDQSAGWKRFELPNNTVAVMIPGTYHGVAGTYSCVPATNNTCAARLADKGFNLGGLRKTWEMGRGCIIMKGATLELHEQRLSTWLQQF